MAYMTSAAIEASLANLAAAFPTLCTKIPLPNAAASGTTSINYSFLRIGKHAVAMPRVALIVAGMHARELAQPDAAISFCLKLLTAYKNKAPFSIDAFRDATGRIFGPVTVPLSNVVAIIENMILLVLPLANPAGRNFVLAADAKKNWRKNRIHPCLDQPDRQPDSRRRHQSQFRYRLGFGHLLRHGRCGRKRSSQGPGGNHLQGRGKSAARSREQEH